MTRRAFLASAATQVLRAAPSKPNIVLILAGDLGPFDLGCYGQKRIQAPNLDRMAAEGMRFTEAIAGACVCAPSRCSLLTGLHGGHARLRDNVPHGVFLRPDDVTVAEVLQQAGYRTCAIGKWSLGNRANKRRSYSPYLLTQHATAFLKENRDRPFFLYFAPTLPQWSDYPKTSPMSQDIPSDEPYSHQDWPQVEKNYAAMVTLLDKQVGDILEQLRLLALEQQTLVLFTSDNGPSAESMHRPDFFHSAGPRGGTKRDLYEGGIRTPLLARWKGAIAPGSVSNTICAFWDFLPTAAELAALPTPAGTDGISLVPALLGQSRREHDHLYWDYGHGRARYSQAVRQKNWKAVRNGSTSPLELYDLAADPGESTNVTGAHPDIARRMADLMRTAVTPSPEYPILDRKK